ncbi:unnamed protein product [Thlaspi arvense]|uniref:Uncharacterized protein n=1 Tax=Thlaspi arvense TaxID=13288 RepID=A0AAU9SVT9_THLAR|nr:unnamed protein product [Thlaspi arvense]
MAKQNIKKVGLNVFVNVQIQNIVKMMTVIALNAVKSNVVARIHPMVLLLPHRFYMRGHW